MIIAMAVAMVVAMAIAIVIGMDLSPYACASGLEPPALAAINT